MASGRIVVVAALQGATGIASTVLGVGPLLESAGAVERVVALIGIALGTIMVVAAIALILRRGPARALGLAGGSAMIVLGLLVALLGATSLGTCDTRDSQAIACYVVIVMIGVVGIAVAGAGAGSVAVISRARPEALRRDRRR